MLKRQPRILFILLLLLPLVASLAAGAPPLMGDYDAELRDGQHVDVPKMIDRLNQLRANTYMWLIWHSPHDWDDLKQFLPLAEKAGISVWVYLVPHSETAVQDPQWPYSEPFKVDYVRWAEEIAKLSLAHKNLVGYVIDDFWANVKPGRFTPEYTRRMVQAGKTINPNIKFYPLMYFWELDTRFVDQLATIVDGVVAAYPKDRKDIEHALTFLNDNYNVPANVTITFPWDTPSRPSNGGFIAQTATVDDAKHASVSFHYEDDFKGPTEDFHFMQFRVNDKVMWEQDVAGSDAGAVSIDLSKVAGGAQSLQLSFGVFDKKGVANFGVRARFSDLRVTGLEMRNGAIHSKGSWRQDVQGIFQIQFRPPYVGKGRYHLPLIVMPAGCRSQFEKRYDEEGTPRNIAKKVHLALELAAEGKVEGVVTYCLDKREGSKDFEAIRNEFKRLTATQADK